MQISSLHGLKARIFCSLALVLCGYGLPAYAADFKLSLASEMTMSMQGKEQKMDTLTEIEYRWQPDGTARALLVDSVYVKVKNETLEMPPTFLSRDKIVTTEDGKRKEIRFQDAPAEMKTTMEDSYGSPLYRREISAEGEALGGKTVAGPGAESLMKNGIVANCLIFHPLPARGKAEWETDAQMSMGNGGYVTGKLRYKRKASAQGGEAYSIEGTLSKDTTELPEGVIIKDARYQVAGEAIFDSNEQEWLSGKIELDVAFRIFLSGKEFSKAKGKIDATLQRRDK